jgi:hypothetical protein
VGRRSRRVRESLGFFTPYRKPDDGYRLVPLKTKRDKWEYMKQSGLDEVYLQIKAVFGGGIDEPIISHKKAV